MTLLGRPAADEAAAYYFKYFDLVPKDARLVLAEQQHALEALRSILPERASYRYAEDKWSIREVIGHLIDCERLFVFRAFWFARGFDSPLPSFDQEKAATSAGAQSRDWEGLVAELVALRASTVSFFNALPDDAWDRRGVASGAECSVRALAYLAAGHVTHHLHELREKYGWSG